MEIEKLNTYFDQITQMVIEYAPRLALAIILLIVGIKIINKLKLFKVFSLDVLQVIDP